MTDVSCSNGLGDAPLRGVLAMIPKLIRGRVSESKLLREKSDKPSSLNAVGTCDGGDSTVRMDLAGERCVERDGSEEGVEQHIRVWRTEQGRLLCSTRLNERTGLHEEKNQ